MRDRHLRRRLSRGLQALRERLHSGQSSLHGRLLDRDAQLQRPVSVEWSSQLLRYLVRAVPGDSKRDRHMCERNVRARV